MGPFARAAAPEGLTLMPRVLAILSLAALLTIPAVEAQARPARTHPNAAIRARQSAMDAFTARMSRLDTLMGVPSASSRVARSRSAEAGR